MHRLLVALALAAFAMLPISVAATPLPSPTLAQIMLPAPSGYTARTSTFLDGSFTSHDYSSAWGAKAAEVQRTLEQDGFVDGYGWTWINQPAQRGLVEYIVAFAGARGAKNWLDYAKASDLADPTYRHADAMAGIGPYYGEHNVYPTNDVSDAFAFVKGNDMFVVGFESTQDDVLDLAIARTKNQYDSAPASTIPPAQWPENREASKSSSPQGAAFALGGLAVAAITAVLAVGVILLVAGLILRNQRRRAPAVAAIQMSPDGGSWWDGQAWRDTAHDVPPVAQRSADGQSWWDGRQWRPVP